MAHGHLAAVDGPRLVRLLVGDEPEAWSRAGFDVVGGVVLIGQVRIVPIGSAAGAARGIVRWEVAGLAITDAQLDGLATASSDVLLDDGDEAPKHPNGVVGLDHLVVLTPDLDRTIAAVEAAGLDLRRVRETTSNESPMRQAFFKLGPVVLEVVSGDVGTGVPAEQAPATFFGLALDVDDLDETAAHLGDGLGRIKPAVQRGRRIATVRHRRLGLSVPVALMDHHGDRTTPDDGR
jgi:hypothetical protein